MTNALVDLLAQRDWLLLDGATGTNLFEMGQGRHGLTSNLQHRPRRHPAMSDNVLRSRLVRHGSYGRPDSPTLVTAFP